MVSPASAAFVAAKLDAEAVAILTKRVRDLEAELAEVAAAGASRRTPL